MQRTQKHTHTRPVHPKSRSVRPRGESRGIVGTPIAAHYSRGEAFVKPAVGQETPVNPRAERRKRLARTGAVLGAAALVVTSFVVGENREAAPKLPVAGTPAAEKGLKTGKYQELTIGQWVIHKDGKPEKLDGINEIVSFVDEYGGNPHDVDLSGALQAEHDNYVESNGTPLADTDAVPEGEVFIVPKMPEFGYSQLPDSDKG